MRQEKAEEIATAPAAAEWLRNPRSTEKRISLAQRLAEEPAAPTPPPNPHAWKDPDEPSEDTNAKPDATAA